MSKEKDNLSQGQIKTEVWKVYDPRVNIMNKRKSVFVRGSTVNSYQSYPCTQVNNNNINIQVVPPNRNIIVNRRFMLNNIYTFTVSGTNTSGGPLLLPGYHSPAFAPLLKTIQSCGIGLNNDTVTQAPIGSYFPHLLRYCTTTVKDNNSAYSLSAFMPDQFSNYIDGQNTIRNPLAPYGDNSFEMTRGGFYYYDLSGNTNGSTSVTITLNVAEPLFVSPLEFGHEADYKSGFIGLNNININITLGDLTKALSIVASQGTTNGSINVTTVSGSLTSSTLYLEYLTPDPLNIIPKEVVYDYSSMTQYPTIASDSVAPGDSIEIAMQAIQLTSIPDSIYFYAKRDQSADTCFTADSYMTLTKLTVTWDNNQYLASASPFDLYQIAAKNKLNMSWSQWNSVGSVMKLIWGSDIGLSSTDCAGLIGNYQLLLTATFRNSNPSVTYKPTLYCIVQTAGAFNIFNGNCSHNIGLFNKQNVVDAKEVRSIMYRGHSGVYGGNWLSDIGSFFKSAYEKVVPVVEKVAKIVPGVKQAYDIYKSVSGSGKKKVKKSRSKKAGAVSGGKNMSRSELKARKKKMTGAGLDINNDNSDIDNSDSDNENNEVDYNSDEFKEFEKQYNLLNQQEQNKQD